MLKSKPARCLQSQILIRTILHYTFSQSHDLFVVLLHIFFPVRYISRLVPGNKKRIHQLIEQLIVVGKFSYTFTSDKNALIDLSMIDRTLKTFQIFIYLFLFDQSINTH